MRRAVYRLKTALKRLPWLEAVNAAYKSGRLVRHRRRLISHYDALAKRNQVTYDPSRVANLVRDRVARRGLHQPLSNRPRVLWVGADENQDLAGFLPALEACSNVTRFYRHSGEYGLRVLSRDGVPRPYDPEVITENDASILRVLGRAREDGAPFDLLLGQMWAHAVSVPMLLAAQKLGCITVNVSMDDRLPELWSTWRGQRLGSVGLVDGLDLVLTTSPECCKWYAVEGCPALWWPLASDPNLFAPRPESEKRFDVSFVGSRYGVRAELVDALLSSGINVSAFGPGWPHGSVKVDQVASIFNESRIILGVGTVGHCRDVFTIKLRDFDATMAGALYVTHRNPDLLELFEEGREIACYSSPEELVSVVRRYLDDPDERMRIAAAGRERAMLQHTWQRRFETLFNLLPGHVSHEQHQDAVPPACRVPR